MAWTVEEGASVSANNPLNSSIQTPGSSPLAGNADGVQIYPSVLSGLDADTQTLLGSPVYATVVAALRAGNVAHAAAALEASPWCVAPGGGQCPGYGAAIQGLVTAWRHSPAAAMGVGAQPVGSVLTPVSTPAGAPADFSPTKVRDIPPVATTPRRTGRSLSITTVASGHQSAVPHHRYQSHWVSDTSYCPRGPTASPSLLVVGLDQSLWFSYRRRYSGTAARWRSCHRGSRRRRGRWPDRDGRSPPPTGACRPR